VPFEVNALDVAAPAEGAFPPCGRDEASPPCGGNEHVAGMWIDVLMHLGVWHLETLRSHNLYEVASRLSLWGKRLRLYLTCRK
jgi:hypothetical protein